ncbi:uncharacterized protein LOC132738591 isoform X1 [Ruditapes philippinarum]|uniref:uncharacterized protein LOC132738591 isoform X1 n=1 Tax=Ruditapes philippinarum TaxID=129788 RepID=UPI00295B3BF6|nr:uncharacterized protein LOC132738591 isoform X1 [Ruditapes philippinarum]
MVLIRRKSYSESDNDRIGSGIRMGRNRTCSSSSTTHNDQSSSDSNTNGMNKPWMKKMFTSLFKRKAQNRDQDYELPPDYYFKTVLLGDCNSGKTTLAFKFSCIASKTSYLKRPTGLNINTMEYIDSIIHVAEKKVLIRLYDTAGQEKFRSLTASYYRGAHGCLVLFDVTKESTFNNLTYWLHDLKEYSTHPEISTVIVGTKCHVTPEEREVSHERAVKFAESVGLPYMEVSAEENKNVTEVFEKLADSILENLTKDSTPNMQQPNRVILSKQQKPKKQWCSC